MLTTERIVIGNNKKESQQESLNLSFSSNNSFYENLNFETKRDIIFLIKSGYNKRMIIKLYILAHPTDLSEAAYFLTKEEGIYQHIFYNSPSKEDSCEICGEQKINHIKDFDRTINFSFSSIHSRKINEKKDFLLIRSKEKINYKCKICEENISKNEEIKNKCQQCNYYFCDECLYLYIKEQIKNGNNALFCPECKDLYTNDKIEQILLFNSKDKKEINNLRKLLKKNNTKETVLSNPELMFCPIVNCDGFSKKNSGKEFNICNLGHKFCAKCGEIWHENGQCKEEEKVDQLFQEFCNKYKLKKCPYCKIVTIKKGGCNHITCFYCKKNWCWLCNTIFATTEEHYGDSNNACFNKMMNDNEEIFFCSKCDTETNEDNSEFFDCDHVICHRCFIDNLIQNSVMIFWPEKIIDCIIVGCKGYYLTSGDRVIKFINESNNQQLIKKYKYSILLYDYFIHPFFPKKYGQYLKALINFYGCIRDKFNCYRKYKVLYSILYVIGIIFGCIGIPLYMILVPIVPHIMIISLYNYILIKEIEEKYTCKFICYPILFGEILFFCAFMFSFMIMHYLYTIFFFGIMFLVLLIRNIIYNLLC